MSTFNAKVVGFVDGNSNTAVLPHAFTVRSDADHDGDKVFVYRDDLKTTDGKTEIVEDSDKSKLFKMAHELNQTDEINKNRNSGSLSLKGLKQKAEALDQELKQKGKEGLDTTYEFTTPSQLANLSAKLGFGSNSIGIFAVAGKLTSMLSQSGSKLIKPLDITIGKETKTVEEFTKKNLNDIAVILQAALDITKDPTLLMTGINQATVNVASTMSMLGVNPEEIMEFLNEPVIKKFVSSLYADSHSFKNAKEDVVKETIGQAIKDAQNARDKAILQQYQELSDVSKDLNTLVRVVQMDGNIPNDGVKLRETDAAFEKMYNGKMKLLLNGFESRPLIRHYNNILQMQKKTYAHHFVTESEKYYNAIEKLKDYLSYKNKGKFFSEKRNKKDIDAAFLQMVSQTLIPETVLEEINSVGAEAWVKNFVESINALKVAKINAGMSIEEAYQISESPYADSFESLNEQGFFKLALENPIKYEERLASITNKTQRTVVRNAVNDYMRFVVEQENLRGNEENNAFLDLLDVATDKETDELILTGSKDVRLMTSSDKKKAKDSFSKLDSDTQEKIKAFQLMKYGLKNKFGSLISIMPESFGSDFLQGISKITEPRLYAIPENYAMANEQLIQEYEINDNNTQVIDGNTFMVQNTTVTNPETGKTSKAVQPLQFTTDRIIKDSQTGKLYIVEGSYPDRKGIPTNPNYGNLNAIKTKFSKDKNHTLYDPNTTSVDGKEVFEIIKESKELKNNC